MADDTRSPREIERDLERERQDLERTLDDLSNRFSFEGAWNFLGRQLRTNKGSYGRDITKMMAEKPLAVALTAVGVSWLLFGPSSVPRHRRERLEDERSFGRYPDDEHAAARNRSFFEIERARERRAPDGDSRPSRPFGATDRVTGADDGTEGDREGPSYPSSSAATATGTGGSNVPETRPTTSGSTAPVPPDEQVHEPLVSTRAENPASTPASTSGPAREREEPVSTPAVMPSRPGDDEDKSDDDKKL
ncbi:DUF3618 domain-containing protein [Palleronia sp.]|uniref:DUF3618 domain-containing protein n=1 Tax=Palleronia sp. TaxID=1940284 RepID=UPI0035C7C28E